MTTSTEPVPESAVNVSVCCRNEACPNAFSSLLYYVDAAPDPAKLRCPRCGDVYDAAITPPLIGPDSPVFADAEEGSER